MFEPSAEHHELAAAFLIQNPEAADHPVVTANGTVIASIFAFIATYGPEALTLFEKYGPVILGLFAAKKANQA